MLNEIETDEISTRIIESFQQGHGQKCLDQQEKEAGYPMVRVWSRRERCKAITPKCAKCYWALSKRPEQTKK